jgi:hypothetical protein
MGVADRVHEVPSRLDYLDALAVQAQASALLLLGSTERHYTASRLYPALLAGRPLLAVYHEESPVVDALRRLGGPPCVRLVTFGGARGPADRVEAICEALDALAGDGAGRCPRPHGAGLAEYSAEALAGRLAGLLDGLRR